MRWFHILNNSSSNFDNIFPSALIHQHWQLSWGATWLFPKVKALDQINSHCVKCWGAWEKQFRLKWEAISSLPCSNLPLYLKENEARRNRNQVWAGVSAQVPWEIVSTGVHYRLTWGLTLRIPCKAHCSMVACGVYRVYNWKKLRHTEQSSSRRMVRLEIKSVLWDGLVETYVHIRYRSCIKYTNM